MVIEHATFVITEGQESAFEAAVASSRHVFSTATGCRSVSLMRCVERPGIYRLSIEWDSLENHTVDFKNSPQAKVFGGSIAPFIAERQPLFHFTPVE